jgi:CHC2 zinc finger
VIVHEYHESREGNPPPHPRGVSYRKPIDVAKESVTVLELAERLVGKPLTRRWQSYVACCPLPDHEDKTPSFYVYADNNRGWTCFGCGRGGDVVHLFALAHGHDHMGKAAAYLLLEFGHELPQRPPSWFRRQERQKPVRDAIYEMRFEHLRRRLFRRFCVPVLKPIEDEQERDEEAAVLWDMTRPLAKMLLADLEARRSA